MYLSISLVRCDVWGKRSHGRVGPALESGGLCSWMDLYLWAQLPWLSAGPYWALSFSLRGTGSNTQPSFDLQSFLVFFIVSFEFFILLLCSGGRYSKFLSLPILSIIEEHSRISSQYKGSLDSIVNILIWWRFSVTQVTSTSIKSLVP